MADFFGRNANGMQTTPRNNFETRYQTSVTNLLLVVIFSLINIVLLVANADTYFLFSAFIPYLIADWGMYYGGMYPEDYYYASDMEYISVNFLIVALVVAAVILLLYFLSWFFARKQKVGWLIFALVFFCIDTAVMLFFTGFALESLVDIIFHAWVIVSLSIGITTYYKMKKLPEDETVSEFAESMPEIQEQTVGYSNVLRTADPEVKSRTLLEAEALGHHVVYRRVKKVNELVIDGRVYDEYEALIEFPHTLCAVVGGHKFEVRYDSTSHMYIFADGQQVAKKLRII